MTTQSNYEAAQDLNRYEMLINTKEILTQDEYEFCKAWDAAEAWKYLNNIGPDYNTGEQRWLNINVYSEHEHDEHQLRMERGI
jgi:hypothetical protein